MKEYTFFPSIIVTRLANRNRPDKSVSFSFTLVYNVKVDWFEEIESKSHRILNYSSLLCKGT
jgi:hypothetical protein